MPRPEGASPLRYRDAVFADVTVTSNLVYGSAPDLQGNPVTLRLTFYRPAGDTQMSRPALVWRTAAALHERPGRRTPCLWTSRYRPARLRGGVDRLPPARPAGLLLEPLAGGLHLVAVRWRPSATPRLPSAGYNAATYGVDLTRIGIGGESAGGITATLVGVCSPRTPGVAATRARSSTVKGFVSVAGGLPDGLFAGPGDAQTLLPRHG